MTGNWRELNDQATALPDIEAPVEFYGSGFRQGYRQPRSFARQLQDQLVRSWRCMLGARPQESLEHAARVASQLRELEPAAAERCRTQVCLIRAFGKALSDDPEGLSLELSGAANNPRCSHTARMLLRFAYWRLSRWSDFYSLPLGEPATTPSDVFARVFDQVILATAALERLQLITASRFATDAMSMAEAAGTGTSIAAASAASVLASVQYELGYLEQAEQLVLSRLPIICEQGTPDVIIRVHLLLSRIAQHRGQAEHAAVVLNEGQSLGEWKGCARIVVTMMAERVRILLACDDTARARLEVSTMMRYAQTHVAAPYVRQEIALLCTFADVQVMVAEGHTFDAVAALRTMLGATTTAQRRYTALRLSLELAGALSASGQEDRAWRMLVRALKTGERAGLLHCWIDASRSCRALLERMAQRLPQASSPQLAALEAYLRTILGHQSTSKFFHERPHGHAVRVTARLSARERTVLVLVAQGQSNKRAAKTLSVTPETIKSHLKRVFLKLGAKTRAEAVSRAADLGQLIGVLAPVVAKSEHFWS
jgi:LuxR family transcriptional regulator, maltose regulon positive regulatory protein